MEVTVEDQRREFIAGVLAALYESHLPVLSTECLDSEPKAIDDEAETTPAEES